MKFNRKLLKHREPDFIIGTTERPYLRRWWLTERIEEESKVYLHNIKMDDDDRALHDHPSNSVSIPLRGGYIEHLFAHPPVEGKPLPPIIKKRRYPFVPVFRTAATAHRLELRRDKNGNVIEAWTIFIFGPKIQEWGFWCEDKITSRRFPHYMLKARWKHWTKFVAVGRPGEIGQGCGEA